MAKVTFEITDNMDGSVSCKLTPPFHELSRSIGLGVVPTPAQVYAMEAVKAIMRVSTLSSPNAKLPPATQEMLKKIMAKKG